MGDYGGFTINRKSVLAHRYGYELLVGPIPEGLFVCHSCDNRICQNPNHWFLGTPADNMADRDHKQRQAKGEDIAQARLTAADVRGILWLLNIGIPQRRIAGRYGVAQPTVQRISNGQTWKHIERKVTV